MKVKVTIGFPCSAEDWAKLCQIRALMDGKNVSSNISQESPIHQADRVDEDEAKKLDELAEAAHSKNETPLMDSLEDNPSAQNKNPDSISSLMMEFFRLSEGPVKKSDLVEYVSHVRSDMTLHQVRTNLDACAWKAGVKKNNGIWSLNQ